MANMLTEVPLAEEHLDSSSWHVLDFAESGYVNSDDYRCRKNISSAYSFRFGTSTRVVFWLDTVMLLVAAACGRNAYF